ncbi:MAG: ABC-type transport auxiliary lipoprotein family protein [Desulfobacteraceae bacterium]|nr:ABC-type transport auxiliary lipoprotein family protein [Desulfobacteraceae bacterium]
MTGKTIPLVLLLLFLLPACINLKQPYREVHYYTLEYPPPRFPDLKPLPVILRVEPFTVSPEYDTDRIVFRNEAYARNTYAYHRWRARPNKLVRDFLARDLRRSGLFLAVFTGENVGQSDYALEGSVEDLLEWDQKAQWLAVLTVDVTLLASREEDITRRIIFQKTFSARQPAARKDPQAIAAAMSQAMASVSGEIIRAVHAAIAAAPPGEAPQPGGSRENP